MVELGGAAGADDARKDPAPPAAAPTKAIDPYLVTWEGYLWRDAQARVRVGFPFVDEQVILGASRIVPEPLATALEPFVSPVKDDGFGFAFELVGRGDDALDRAPRHFVKVRGHLGGSERAVHHPLESGHELTLRDATLVSIETLSRDWLVAWRKSLLRDLADGSASKDRPTAQADERKTSLRVRLEALAAMRAARLDVDSALSVARKASPGARSSAKFRHRIERRLERSILRASEALGVAPPESFTPTRLPPDAWDALEWIKADKTRTEFLARTAKAWTGEPEEFEVSYYVADAVESGWMETADLETIRGTWDDTRYERVRAATLAIAPRVK